MPVSRAYMPEPVKTAELIQGYLAAVGINAKIVRYEWGVYLDKTAKGEHDLCMMGWLGGNADPDNFLYGLLSSDSAKPLLLTLPFGRTRSLISWSRMPRPFLAKRSELLTI